MEEKYKKPEDVLNQAKTILNKTLREVIPPQDLNKVLKEVTSYASRRKGLLGDYIEQFVFDKKPDSRSEADFSVAGVEVKTTPLKEHAKNTYAAKERLVFSMIDYGKMVNEKWDTSSFLKKNKLLLIMFYLYTQTLSILDYKFKYIELFDLFKSISDDDMLQIQKDWETIATKIRNGKAHLLSEADTFYLGACTKAKNSSIVKEQPKSHILAKPRAFSLKQQYLNYIIQKNLLGNKIQAESILSKAHKKSKVAKTIEQVINEDFSPFFGKTDRAIKSMLDWHPEGKPKNYKRLLINKILGINSSRIEELEKANITLKVITLENNGSLRESISFPAFDYIDLATQVWYDGEKEVMSDFHAQLETKKFLFVVFRKINDEDVMLEKVMFWNFPMEDIEEARRVWKETINCINEGRYHDLPRMKDSKVAHVRPHGKDGLDKIKTPQETLEMRRSFWLNAKYIQHAIEDAKDQD